MKTRHFLNSKFIDDKVLVSCETDVSKDICDKFGLDFKQKYVKNIQLKKK